MSRTPYSSTFYSGQEDGSLNSARAIVPFVRQITGDPASVLDVGCGVGTWLSVWVAAGVSDVVGVDGDYVQKEALHIPVDRFVSHDLSEPLDLGRGFDIVVSLEVAEHLPEEYAERFVESLIRHSDTVLFSAAVPGQGGTHHVNERWPSYWAEKFGKFGHLQFDVVRPEFWQNGDIRYWYAQNTFLYLTPNAAERLGLGPEHRGGLLDVVHPKLLDRKVYELSHPLFRTVYNFPFRKRLASTRLGRELKQRLKPPSIH